MSACVDKYLPKKRGSCTTAALLLYHMVFTREEREYFSIYFNGSLPQIAEKEILLMMKKHFRLDGKIILF